MYCVFYLPHHQPDRTASHLSHFLTPTCQANRQNAENVTCGPVWSSNQKRTSAKRDSLCAPTTSVKKFLSGHQTKDQAKGDKSTPPKQRCLIEISKESKVEASATTVAVWGVVPKKCKFALNQSQAEKNHKCHCFTGAPMGRSRLCALPANCPPLATIFFSTATDGQNRTRSFSWFEGAAL